MRRQNLFGIVVLAALLTLPGAAVAKGGRLTIGARQSAEFQLKGSKGYSISVFGGGGQVTLTASHKGSSASYTAKGLASATQIKARLGRLGRVSVRFHSHGNPRHVPFPQGNCQGGDETVESGTWVGQIEFEGEQAYTAVHATRAKGEVANSEKLTCSKQQGKESTPPGFQWTILSASSDARGVFSTAFLVSSDAHPDLGGSSFGASLLEVHRRGMSIVRTISADAKSDAFAVSEEGGHITSATVAPPAPFKGTATFQRTKGSKGSWAGALAGDFPGRGEVTLAGPEFSAEVSRIGG
jgi:hypothetical protein